MSTPCENCGSDFKVCIDCDLYNGKYIEIPNNATNGQVIRALFNPTHVERTDDGVIVKNYDFDKEWWNLSYKR